MLLAWVEVEGALEGFFFFFLKIKAILVKPWRFQFRVNKIKEILVTNASFHRIPWLSNEVEVNFARGRWQIEYYMLC